jgi:S-adenosylmethionine synthetase
MPLPIYLSHRLVEKQAELRKNGKTQVAASRTPKSQVTVKYVDGKPGEIDTVVLSTQHHPDVEHKQIEQAVIEEIIKPVLAGQTPLQEHQVPGEPDRPLRGRWSAG